MDFGLGPEWATLAAHRVWRSYQHHRICLACRVGHPCGLEVDVLLYRRVRLWTFRADHGVSAFFLVSFRFVNINPLGYLAYFPWYAIAGLMRSATTTTRRGQS